MLLFDYDMQSSLCVCVCVTICGTLPAIFSSHYSGGKFGVSVKMKCMLPKICLHHMPKGLRRGVHYKAYLDEDVDSIAFVCVVRRYG